MAAALDAGADIDGQDDAGDTALLDAVTSDDGPMVDLLLTRGADVDIANEGGHTPLLRAVGFNRPLLVARLLAAGADPNVPATVTGLEIMAASRRSPRRGRATRSIPRASRSSRRSSSSAPPSGERTESGFDAITGVTPLYVAVVVSSDEIVHALLDAGADPTIGAGPAAHHARRRRRAARPHRARRPDPGGRRLSAASLR